MRHAGTLSRRDLYARSQCASLSGQKLSIPL